MVIPLPDSDVVLRPVSKIGGVDKVSLAHLYEVKWITVVEHQGV
jgi:hypothetical protein